MATKYILQKTNASFCPISAMKRFIFFVVSTPPRGNNVFKKGLKLKIDNSFYL